MANTLTLGTSAIRELDGLFSLNDIHAASGGDKAQQPSNFMRLDQTQALVAELNSSDLRSFQTITGRNGGTYACRELVIAYAAWISATFHLKVIRVFLGQQAPASETPSPESATPLLNAPTQSTLTEQQCQSAIAAAGLASFQVQMALARAVIAGGDDWKHQRWLIYFTADSKVGTPPVVECVGPDLRTVAQLCKAIKRGEISNTALLELTAASTTALAAEMRAGKTKGATV